MAMKMPMTTTTTKARKDDDDDDDDDVDSANCHWYCSSTSSSSTSSSSSSSSEGRRRRRRRRSTRRLLVRRITSSSSSSSSTSTLLPVCRHSKSKSKISSKSTPLMLILLLLQLLTTVVVLPRIANVDVDVHGDGVVFVSGFSFIGINRSSIDISSNSYSHILRTSGRHPTTTTAASTTTTAATPLVRQFSPKSFVLSSSTALSSTPPPVGTTNDSNGGGSGSGSSSSSSKKKKKSSGSNNNKKRKKSKPNRKHLEQHHHPSNNRNDNRNDNDPKSLTQTRETQDRQRPAVQLPRYEDQLGPRTQQGRLSSSGHPDGRIDCIHYREDQCPGCSVDRGVADVNIISSSSRQFFKSTVVQKHRLYDDERYDYDYDMVDDDDDDIDDGDGDGFYRVVVPSKVTGWRTQAKLVATNAGSSQWTRDGCRFGLYARGSHTVIPIPDCEVHHPSINEAVQVLEEATRKVGTVAAHTNSQDGWMKRDTRSQSQGGGGGGGSKGYQGTQNQRQANGGLRYIQLQVERTTGKVQLVLVWSASQLKEAQPSLTRLIKEVQKLQPDLWHSVWCHCNDGAGNNIFSRAPGRWHHMMGPEYVREPLSVGENNEEGRNGGWLYFSPLCFRQGNMDGFDVIAQDVARAVPGGSKVCELYAGVGLLGLTALAYHHRHHDNEGEGEGGDCKPLTWVRCSDENPANPKSFKKSVQSLPQGMTRHDGSNGGRMSSSSSSSQSNNKKEMTLAEIMEKMKAGEDVFDSNEDGDAPQRTGPKATYLVASAGQALKAGQALGADVLIVDPPRKGLEDDVLDQLCKPINTRQPMVESPNMLALSDDVVNWTNDVKTLVYVSCGFDALVFNCERLLSSPAGWKLQSSTGYVLFPGSNHVETLCIFQRK